MRPRVELRTLREVGASEYAVRFAFGGTMTAVAGLIAHVCGPRVGGLFLAFPAILPASLTLVARHRGRRTAAEEARGSIIGAVALVIFAASARSVAEGYPPPLTLAVASVTWMAAALLLWWAVHRLRS